MAALALFMQLEEEFGVTIPDTEIDKLAKVRNLVALLGAVGATGDEAEPT
jgi:acyl carrier protein